MKKPLDDLHAERAFILSRLVDELATERGLESGKLAPAARYELAYHAEVAYETWSQKINDGEIPTPSTPVEYLLAQLSAVDDIIREMTDSRRKSGDS